MKISDTFGFGDFYREVKDKNTNFQVAYKLAKLAKKIEEEQQFYYETLGKLIREYAEKDDTGNPVPTEDGRGYKIRPDVQDECNQRLSELVNLDIDIEPTLTMNDLEGLSISAQLIGGILPFIKE